MPDLPPCLVLTGPTAVGKTGTLEYLSRISPWPVEAVSADAFQVYRCLDRGTAKPEPYLLAKIPHHLIDIRDIDESYTVGDFVRDAACAVADIRSRGRLPVICGGSVYYLKHFLEGAPGTPPADPVIRDALQEAWNDGGNDALRAELARVDPVSAVRIHPNDRYRILRALEVWRTAGRPLSAFANTGANAAAQITRSPVFILERPREELVERIGLRVKDMFRGGLAEEVQALAVDGATPGMPGMRAIGYQEFFRKNAEGTWILRDDLVEVEAEIVIHTRQYAKRQMTFLRSLEGALWLSAADPAAAAGEMIRRVQKPDADG
jgi:tRNA dimethylallyltransferase